MNDRGAEFISSPEKNGMTAIRLKGETAEEIWPVRRKISGTSQNMRRTVTWVERYRAQENDIDRIQIP